MGTQPAAGEEELGQFEKEVRNGAVRVVALRDLCHRHDEALDLVGDLNGEVVRIVLDRIQCGVRHRATFFPRRPAPA
jgi:hypothetical protein